MSGTEAVMQAVRLARYHTGRRYLVRFCGAYHGWWGEVQPGVGNPVKERDTLTLKDMDEQSLRVLRSRGDIACVLVNALQALHPNAGAPADSTLVDSGPKAAFDRAAYTDWLQRLRRVCSERGIVLIFDEVFLGFRLARGGVQEYFGVRADMVTYGKTVAGGLPIGVVCGRADLMKRFREDRPADVCFARGTFNSHPYVMGAMAEFLERLDTPEILDCYRDLDAVWNGRAAQLNERLREAGVQVQGGELVFSMDGLLSAALALPLDVSVLSARRKPGAELGRNGTAHLQPGLHGCGLCRGRRPVCRGGAANAAGWLVVGGQCAHHQID